MEKHIDYTRAIIGTSIVTGKPFAIIDLTSDEWDEPTVRIPRQSMHEMVNQATAE